LSGYFLTYIFVCIYANYGLDDLIKVIEWFNDPFNSKQFSKLNDPNSYKTSVDKVVSSSKLIEWYKTIIKLILKKDSDLMIETKSVKSENINTNKNINTNITNGLITNKNITNGLITNKNITNGIVAKSKSSKKLI